MSGEGIQFQVISHQRVQQLRGQSFAKRLGRRALANQKAVPRDAATKKVADRS